MVVIDYLLLRERLNIITWGIFEEKVQSTKDYFKKAYKEHWTLNNNIVKP